MTIRVLGPMDVGGPRLSPRERAVLSALIVRRDSSISAGELGDAIWGEEPPATWQQQVRNAVARIRSRLGTEAIRTARDTYRLGLEATAIDAVQFEDLVRQARTHSLEGYASRAVTVYERALGLWRGAPLPDVASWPPGQVESSRLSEVRTNAEEELLDARLRAGEKETVVPDAERLVREEPLRESRWAILARANYRADRQAQAIAVLRAARTRLNEDLGIDPSRTLTELEAAILRQDPDLERTAAELDPEVPLDQSCPYRGLAPYGTDDAAIFFGRDGDAEELVARCRPRAVVTITGPSGSGKSSLLRAGLIPRLREQGRSVEIVTPDAAGIAALRDIASTSASVIAIDQAEELLALHSDHRRGLAEAAARWVDDGGCLVVTLRSDFLDRATALPAIGPVLGRTVFAVPPLDPMMLRLAITGPAQHAGYALEPGLLEIVLRDAGDRRGILPALSHTLSATWGRREGRLLTVAGYEATGGIAGAIAKSAEQVYDSLSPASREACRGLMMRLLERTPDATDVRRRVPLETLTADTVRRDVVERLVSARLVTIDADAAIIAHEAVGTTWPRLDRWLRDDAANAQMLRSVEAGAAAWDAEGRKPEDLLRGSHLEAAQEWRERSSPDLTAQEAAFLDASAAAHRAEVRDLEARAAHERTRNRRLRVALAAAGILLVVAVVAGGIAAVRGADAEAAALDARIEALAATALSIRDSDREAAALLAAQLYRRWPDDPRTRSALMSSTMQYGGLVQRVPLPEGSIAAARLIPGTHTALVVLDRPRAPERPAIHSVGIIDLDTGAMREEWDITLPEVPFEIQRDLVVSDDGSVALVQTGALRRADDPASCCKNYLSVIDLETGELRFDTLELDARTGQKPALSADGAHAYLAHFVTGSPSRLDLVTGVVTEAQQHDADDFENIPGHVNGLALVDDRIFVGTGSEVLIFDADSLEPAGTIPLPGTELSDVLLLADRAGGLITAGRGGATRIDLKTLELTWHRDVRGSVPCVNGAALSEESFLCATGNGGSVREHDLATGAFTGREYPSLLDEVRWVDVLPSGEEFIAVVPNFSTSILRWRVDQLPSIARPIAEGYSLAGPFGDGGRLVIAIPRREFAHALLPGGAVVDDGAVPPLQLWDVRADRPVGPPHTVLTWASDTTVAHVDGDGPWTLENVATGATRTVGVDDVQWIVPGADGSRAFAITPGAIVPVDPSTGEPSVGVVPISFAGEVSGVTEIPGTDRIAVLWWNDAAARDETTVFELTTGEQVAHGLEYDLALLGMPDGSLLSANNTRLLRSDADLVPAGAMAKPGGSPVRLETDAAGRTVLVASLDQRLSLYDMRDGRRLGDELVVLEDPDLLWARGALGPDGETLVTSTADGLLLWDLRAESLLDAACARVGRQLTEVEWRTYIGDEPYQQTCPEAP